MRRPAAFLLVATLALGPGASLAAAQDPGITIEPGSPSGTEYKVPLDTARHELSGRGGSAPAAPASGSGASGGPSSGGAPLFGVGVGSDTATGGGAGGSARTAKRSTRPRAKAADSPASGATAAIRATAERPLASEDGGSSLWPLLGAAGGLLLAGAAAGLVVKRRQAS